MIEKTVETGYVVHVPKGKVFPTKFVRGNGLQATGIDAKTGRESWIYGRWTPSKMPEPCMESPLTLSKNVACGWVMRISVRSSLRSA